MRVFLFIYQEVKSSLRPVGWTECKRYHVPVNVLNLDAEPAVWSMINRVFPDHVLKKMPLPQTLSVAWAFSDVFQLMIVPFLADRIVAVE